MASKISKVEAMATEKIPKLVMSFSLTAFVSLFFNAVYNLVDALFVSRGVGDNAMGGVSIVFPFMIIQSAIAQTVGGGAASIVSRLLGKQKAQESGEVTANAMAIFYISAVIVTVLGFIFMNPILSVLGATEDIYPYAKEYFTIMLLGNVFSTGFSSIIRAEGRMTYSLLIWLIPTAVNIILDGVFIFGLEMGVKGAALATVLSQFVSFLMSMFFFVKLSCQNFKGAKLKLGIMKDIITTGLPTFIQMSSLSVMTMLMNKMMSITGGTIGVNAFSYVSKITTFLLVPFNSLTQATAPIIGFNYGANSKSRVKDTVKFSVVVSTAFSVVALAVMPLISKYLIMIFTESTELVTVGAKGLNIISFSLPFTAILLIAGSFYQAVGKKKTSLFLNISPIIFLIPCIIILSKLWGVDGIWWSFVFAYISSFAVTIAVLMINKHNVKN